MLRVRSASAGPSELERESRPPLLLLGVLMDPRRPAPHCLPPGPGRAGLAVADCDWESGVCFSGSDCDDQLSLSLPPPAASLTAAAATSVAATSAAANAAATGSLGDGVWVGLAMTVSALVLPPP